MRTYVYIDGFNFYYGAVFKTAYKWLDFKSLLQNLLDPKHNILKIKYFTALVTGKIDPYAPVRQKTFLRALQKYIPELSIYYGTFNSHDVVKPLACQNKKFPRPFFVPVVKTEEKGSDVNLAVHLLNDAWLNEYDCAVVVSNDSDLAESLRIVMHQLNKVIGLINPRNKTPARKLMQYCVFRSKVTTHSVLLLPPIPLHCDH
jgi:uncharacterized LabA/DUF88 family protein